MKRSWIRFYLGYKQSGLLFFLRQNLLKFIFSVALFISILLSIKSLFPDTTSQFALFIEQQSTFLIYAVFFLSESIFGILPPDLFIIWTKGSEIPIVSISFLAILSYCGGLVSYGIGSRIGHIERIENWLRKKLKGKSEYIESWGGAVVVIAALFPLPFSPVCMAAGMIGYSYKTFLLFSSFRILRFYIYALMLFQLF